MDFSNHPLSTNTVSDTGNNNLTNTVSDTVAKSKQVDLIADKLVTELNNPNRRPYYCKISYKLSESQIWNNLETAQRGRNPQRLFTWLCQRDMLR